MEQKLRVIEEEIQQKKFSEADKKLKRDLKRYRALLEDAHIQLENYKNDSNRVNQVKSLKQEIEDIQLELQAAIRSKKQMETEFEDLQNQHTEQFNAKTVLEEQLSTAKREVNNAKTHIEDVEDECQEFSRKIKQTISQNTDLQKQIVEIQSRAD